MLYGGRSAEHEISCISARHVLDAADPERYDVRVVGITTDGDWVDATSVLEAGGDRTALPSPDSIIRVEGAEGAEGAKPTGVEAGSPGDLDGRPPVTGPGAIEPVRAVTEPGRGPLVVLPLLHGPMGEDGSVQGLLDVAGVAYCGTGVGGSAAAMDKGTAKSLLAAAGIPQARWISLREHEIDDSLPGRVARELGWPVFVKPANMGSSIGITKARDPSELDTAVETATRYDEFIVIEEAVSGRELEIGVLGWPALRASVPGEIKPSHEFYDFEDKYLEEGAGLLVPAPLEPAQVEEVQRLALAAYRALQVDGMARVDFFYEEDGRGFLLNELNTLPGFTPISMYPRLWAESGLSYRALVDELVRLALDRHARRAAFETERRS